MRGLHVVTAAQLTETEDILVKLYPNKKARREFLETPQPGLDGRSPYEAIMNDPPNGLRDVVRLLGRAAKGIPA